MLWNPNNLNRIALATGLGLLALVGNLFSFHYLDERNLPLGDLFLFLAASGFPPALTACATLVAELPLIFTSSHQPAIGLQVILFITSLSLLIRRFPSQSPFFFFPVLWLTLAALCDPLSHLSSKEYQIWMCAQLTLFGVSRLLLLLPIVSRGIYGTLTRLTFTNLIPELLAILTTVTIGSILFQHINGQWLLEITIDKYGKAPYFFFALVTTIVPFIGRMLTRTILVEYAPDIQAIIKSSFAPSEFKFSRSNWFQRPPTPVEEKTSYRPTSEAVLAIAEDNSLILISVLAAEYLDIPASSSLVGRNIEELCSTHPIFQKITQICADARAKGPLTEEVRFEGADELSHKFISFSAEPEAASNDPESQSGNGIVLRLKDVSAHRTLGRAVLDKKRRENLGYIAASVSHAFADALTATQTLAGMGLRGETTTEKNEALRLILQVSESVELIVQQLIEFAESHPGTRSTINLCSVLTERIEFLRQCVGNDASLQFTCAPRSLTVNVNVALLIQALSHLLINAKESFAGRPAEIDLEVDSEIIDETVANVQPGAKPGTYARLRVKDTGNGMTAETLNRAFDPLYTTKSGHSGIGLSIVFGVLRAHDGFLTVESAVDKGTTVSIYLPLLSNG